jgi:hypothetical protein
MLPVNESLAVWQLCRRSTGRSAKTLIFVFQTGEELAEGCFSSLRNKSCRPRLQSIGAFSSVRLGSLRSESKRYEPSVTLDDLSIFEDDPPHYRKKGTGVFVPRVSGAGGNSDFLRSAARLRLVLKAVPGRKSCYET